jgi:pimeloyl-ACP methyl ester carboxylesterase
MQLRFGIDFNKIAPVNNIPHADADILLIHGDEDDTIPLAQGQALAGAGNAEKTQLWIVPGKGHSDCDSHPQFWEKVEAFLQVTLPLST